MRRIFFVSLAGLTLVTALGCSGLSDKALDMANQSPEFQKSFKESFKTQFVEQCASAATENGAPAGKTKDICACAADDLVSKRSPKELTKLLSNIDEPAFAKEMAEIMKRCAL